MTKMKRLTTSFVMVSAVLLTAGTVHAADYIDTGDGLWNTAANWSDNTVPAGTDVRIGNSAPSDQTATIGSGVVATASRVRLGEDGNTGTLIIDGGSLSTSGDDVRLGADSSSIGILNLLSGSMIVDKDLEIGQQGAGTLTMTTGTITVNDDIVLGTGFAGVFNLNGGTISQTGTYEGNGLLDMGANGLLNIAGTGKLILYGNQETIVNGYFDNGWITSDLGFIATDTVTNPGFTTVTTSAIPEPATLGMVAVFGGAILFVRRRFMI